MSWHKTTTIYQIYPRSFYDSNADGIGDIQGIIQKLDYIQELGFETIWISPFFTSPQKDFGYDISDYRSISSEYGTMNDVDELIKAVHQRNMKLVLDMVMNHTSDQHPWFLESKSSTTNSKADWYIWKDKPNNWKSIIGPKGWQYCKARNQYYFTSFLPFQPDLNYRNPEVKKEMFETCRFWLEKGVDGFRLDIFNCIIKNAEFKNNPFSLFHIIPSEEFPGGNFQIRKYSLNQNENFVLAQELRNVIDEFKNPPRMLLGEVFGGHEKIKQYLGKNQDGLHLVFLFDILFYKFNAAFFRKKILEYETHYPSPNCPTTVFSNHDQLRSIKRIDNNIEKAKLLAVLQFTLRGVPCVYYGEEIGMINGNIPIREAKDTLAKMYHWVPQLIANLLPIPINRDVCRTPMQWNKNKNAGFSTCNKTWLPVSNRIKNRNVEEQKNQQNSLYNVFKQLVHLRKNTAALNNGSIDIINAKNKNVLAFSRSYEEEKLLVFINFSSISTNIPFMENNIEILFSIHPHSISDGQLKLKAFDSIIIKL